MGEDTNYWQGFSRRRFSRRSLLQTGAMAGIGMAAGVPILGCGSKPRAETTPTAGGGGGQPQSGGILNVGIDGDPPNFNIFSNTTFLVLHTMAPIYNNLVMYDPLNPDKIIGDLAESWTISPDGKVYTFKMVKGAKFHDGKPCTSADVKASFEVVRNPPKGIISVRQDSLDVVDGIETPDEYTVRMTLKRPSPSLMINLASGFQVIYPKHILDAKGSMEKDAIGTGPFKLKEYIRGVSLELVRNPDYHVKGRPYLDGIKFFSIPDLGTMAANIRTGQLDFSARLDPDEVERLAKDTNGKVMAKSRAGYSYDNVLLGERYKPFQDIRLRKALSLAIDRREGIKVVAQGYGEIGGYLPASSGWRLPAAELEKIAGFGKDAAANLAEAKKLMAEAGFPNGFAINMLVRKQAPQEALAVFVKDQLNKIGIDAKLDIQESAKALDTRENRNFDISAWGQSLNLDDPDAIFGEHYICEAVRNYSHVCSQEVEDLFLKQSQTVDLEERKKLVQQMEKASISTFNRIVLYWKTRFVAISSRVRNYEVHASNYNNQRFQDVWIAKS